ncbi:MAG: AAA family ATPase [Methylococcaceae bacterium]
MQIKTLILKNYRRFADLNISFESDNDDNKTTVFIGNNGAGKTAILDALVLNLSWLIARINREKGKGKSIDDTDILNGTSSAIVHLWLSYNKYPFHLGVTGTRKGHSKQKIESQLTEVSRLAEIFRQQLTDNSENAPLPLIVYYPVNRVVVDIPLKIRTRHNFEQIDGYDNALQQGVDFRRFFEWFRDREDAENEHKIFLINELREKIFPPEHLNKLEPITEKQLKTIALIPYDKQLNAVRTAIQTFMPDFDNLHVERKPRLRMVVNKNGKKLDVAQLSQGEKSLMSLVGDIARRLAMMNPALENPLEGEGIVLIDEIDMHLHPTWQRSVIGNLNKTFPNCQFILTTHSPIVISETPNLLVYALDDGEITKLNNLYGMDVNDVLLSEMHAAIRNIEVQDDFDGVLNSLQEGDLENAKLHCAALQQKVAVDNLELNKMQLLIKRLEVQRAKNN